MYLLLKSSSVLVAALGLMMGCAPSEPGVVLDKPGPQAITSDAESPSPAGVGLAATEASPVVETSTSDDTATAVADVSPSPQAAIAVEPASKAASPTSNEPAAVFAEGGIAIRGADPVAYFTQGAYVAGSSKYTHRWGGATWQFASVEHRDLFVSNPQQYAPQYGGFCAWAVSQGYTAPVDPTAWDIVGGKLYLNFNARIQGRWRRNVSGHISRANQNWPGVVASRS